MKIAPIRNKRDYEKALRRIEAIWHAKKGTAEADELEVLSVLVEAYESKAHAIALPHPIEAIKFRMEQLGMTQAELGKRLGSAPHTSELMRLKRPLNVKQIRILHEKLDIPAETLIQEYDLAQ